MEIFRRVLQPRAKEYVALPPPPGTGTILTQKQHDTVGLVDFAALFPTLRRKGLAAPFRFDARAYADAAEADFTRYVDHLVASDPHAIDGGLLLAKTTALAAQFRALKDQGPIAF